jgi:hypothetical protein
MTLLRSIKFEFECKLMEVVTAAYISEEVESLKDFINNEFFEDYLENTNYCISNDTIKVVEENGKLVLTYYSKEDGDYFKIKRESLLEIVKALEDIIFKWYK